MPLPAELITEETIATLYDHFKNAAATARRLLDEDVALTEDQSESLCNILDTWHYCEKILLQGVPPERER